MSFFSDIWDVIRRYWRGLAIFCGAAVVIIVAAGLVLSYETTRSSFCSSCHYMDPYVRHWQASSHSEVDCVACHDYGAFNLAVSTVKYWTDTYDSRPKAVVSDQSCLNADCHDRESLDPAVEFRRGILFKHNVHLDQDLRGGKLRCTSCHNQIVQYQDDIQGHMVVNDKSCFVCHFKDAGIGEAITGCNSCHGMPERQVEHSGFVFDHEPYLKLQVECKQCHVSIVRGDGSVAESKCHDCHVERHKAQYSRSELHNIHVSENGIDCYKCHSDIEHGNFTMVGALEVACENCHLRHHGIPKQLYMGIGGADSLDVPSAMFTNQVSCTGCHTHLTPEGEMLTHQEKKEASRQSCVDCHGPGYDSMFDNWVEGSRKVIGEYRAFVEAARQDYRNAGGSQKNRQKARAALSTVEENYNFVREGHIPHNIRYSLYLLGKSADNFESAMREIDKSYSISGQGSVYLDENSCLDFCHGKAFNPELVDYDGRELPHTMHVNELGLVCKNCHSVSEHGARNIEEAVCADCHE